MNDKKINNVYSILPESFYDILAYVVPSSLFVLCLMYIIEPGSIALVLNILKTDSIVFDVFLSFVLFGVLYLIGQITTAISYYIVAYPVRLILSSISTIVSNPNIGIIERWFDIRKVENSSISGEIAKRLARWVLVRNVAFLSIVLIVICVSISKLYLVKVLLLCFVFSMIDFSIRTLWFVNGHFKIHRLWALQNAPPLSCLN